MKTWEMIKELELNPRKIFSCKSNEDNYICIKDDILCWKSGDKFDLNMKGHTYGGTIDKYEWKELRQPVTWRIALEAWLNKANITCSINNCEYQYRYHSRLEDQFGHAIGNIHIKYGTWYIEK